MHIALSFPIEVEDPWEKWTGLKVPISYRCSSNSIISASAALMAHVTITSSFNTPNNCTV
jgi:hypothetical protein